MPEYMKPVLNIGDVVCTVNKTKKGDGLFLAVVRLAKAEEGAVTRKGNPKRFEYDEVANFYLSDDLVRQVMQGLTYRPQLKALPKLVHVDDKS